MQLYSKEYLILKLLSTSIHYMRSSVSSHNPWIRNWEAMSLRPNISSP
jgi:hypothetical protein